MNHGIEYLRQYPFRIGLVFVVLFLGYWYYGKTTGTPSNVSTLKSVKVERGDMRVSVSGSGQVEAVSQVDLKPVIAGDGINVMSVNVKNNQAVKKDQIIAVLDTQDALRDIQNATLDLKSAEVKQKQTNVQFRSDRKTDRYARQAQSVSVAQQRINLEKSQSKLADYFVKAPFDGIVTGLDVQAGDAVSRDTILASVITPNMRIVATLNEVDAVKVVDGARANLSFDALPGVTLAGTVTKIATIGKVTQNVVSYEAEIDLDQQSDMLKPGMSVNADITVDERSQVLFVPNAALTTVNGKITVKKVLQTAGKATAETVTANTLPNTVVTDVETGLVNDVDTEIVKGLAEGDEVVLPLTASSTTGTTSGQGGGIISTLFRGSGGNRGSR